jgi:hypothetical protein
VAPTMTGDTLAGMVAAVRQYMAPILIGADALNRAALAQRCRTSIEHNGGAKAAVEIAMLDLVGKHLGVPCIDLVGGALRRSAEPMWLLGNPDVAADIAEAKIKVGEGYGYFKLKVGVKKVEEEIEAALQARRQLGQARQRDIYAASKKPACCFSNNRSPTTRSGPWARLTGLAFCRSAATNVFPAPRKFYRSARPA